MRLTAPCVASLALALGLTACVTEEEILGGRRAEGAGGAESAGAGSAGTAGLDTADESGASAGQGAQATSGDWSSDTCYEALARGADRDACVGVFSCDTAVRDCCRWSAACLDDTLSLVESCDACGCQTDEECPLGEVCVAGQCAECGRDADCGDGWTCYPGRNCLPGCFQDPGCCSGNLCAAPGCGTTVDLDCSIVGCEAGAVCDVRDRGHFCSCEGGQWLCSVAAPNSCVPR